MKYPHGLEVYGYGFTIVDLNNVGHKDEPWVLAKTVEKVFYVLDPKVKKEYIVVPSKQRIIGVEHIEDQDEYNQHHEVPILWNKKTLNSYKHRL